ncbi:MAG: response regulator [Geothrix sp.]|jgi:two-component system chemotaxis response regulator CheY|uniref:Response regulator n=1 Tax=Candidatus Geothrix odensensis TaxID=2954440 RepID=A0A936F503_9BACT|nr:response regulator [Candidatus Geothrix odensensis]MBP7617488.1 response regulator [Geothrix sp.]MCC6512881.1 response regulator [Geothrix sp.]
MGRLILTVDDSSTMRQMITFTLKGAGFDVLEAGDGVEALEVATGKKLDLIITDVNMPRMDGITLVQRLRALPQFKFTPILVLTTESDASMKQKGKEAGATGWIVKPFSPEKLLDVVNKVI